MSRSGSRDRYLKRVWNAHPPLMDITWVRLRTSAPSFRGANPETYGRGAPSLLFGVGKGERGSAPVASSSDKEMLLTKGPMS
jgi:hypothetical protein